MKKRICFLSIDVEEDLRSDNLKTFWGVEKLDIALDIFRKYNALATLFITGEVLEKYPALVRQWALNNEIACHGYWHQPLSQLPIEDRKRGLADFTGLYRQVLNSEVKGFRAVQNIIDNEQFELLSQFNFLYDSSVVPDYPPLKKYVGYKGPAPKSPYHPKSGNHLQAGEMKILEIPLTPHFLGLPLVGTWLRRLGLRFYKRLFFFHKPEFISFSMHSWDIIPGESKNQGTNYLRQLEAMLGYLKNKGYQFYSGEKIWEEQK
ncbi:MAG: polysaccharide deacetylase family protein [bacterium]